MKKRKFLQKALLLAFLAVSINCATGSRQREEPTLDTPEAHYLQGRQLLSRGDVQEAARQFLLARSLNPLYVPAYEGMGLVELERGDLKKAGQYFEEGRHKDDTYAPLYIGLGRVLSGQGDDQGAIGYFHSAIELDPHNADAFYYMGKTYVNLGQYSQAEESFKKALDRNPSHNQASEDWAHLVRLRKPPGEPPQEYVIIVKKPMITRADFAALLAHQLPLEDLCGSEPQGVPISDIEGVWARWEIQQVVACGLMRVSSEGDFMPSEKMTRLHCALAIEKVLLRATADPGLTQQFAAQSSPYSDVPQDHWAFGAIMLATARGIMEAKANGSFHPDEIVTGYRAMKIVRALKDQL
jgi:tetratricopeptide (TPR) repeat protein